MLNKVIAMCCLLPMVGCSSGNELEENKFKSTSLSVNIVGDDSAGFALESSNYVTNADLWCDDQFNSNLDFDESQSIIIFSNLGSCYLVLKEFTLGGKLFVEDGDYYDDVKIFSYFDDGVVVDRKLVRSRQAMYPSETDGSCQDCEIKDIKAEFPYSILDINTDILSSEILYQKLVVGMAEEPAPTCDSINTKLVQNSYEESPKLVVRLTNCLNTLNTDGLEFGLHYASLGEDGSMGQSFLITDAHAVIDQSSVTPKQDGSDYRIVLEMEEIQDLWETPPSAMEALTSDFVVSIRNNLGVSALVYAIKNNCSMDQGAAW